MQQEIKKCIDILQSGGTILYPTDTIWGIGCDATNANAVDSVFRLKKRVESKSMIILVDSAERLTEYVETVPELAWDLLKSVDTPLTIIYPKAKNLAPNVVAADGSIAIRVVHHEFCCALIKAFGKPVVSTSANISGDLPPKVFMEISPEIIKYIDHVVRLYRDELQHIKPSRIIKLSENGEFRIIRK
jgi:L-threonylcarbamoyladenylate synthase